MSGDERAGVGGVVLSASELRAFVGQRVRIVRQYGNALPHTIIGVLVRVGDRCASPHGGLSTIGGNIRQDGDRHVSFWDLGSVVEISAAPLPSQGVLDLAGGKGE